MAMDPNAEEKEPEQHKESLIQRLIKRHVVQTVAVYVAVAWGAVEILITLQEKLGWPEVCKPEGDSFVCF